jgi:[protein-PII] uridylyltransferase
MDVLAADLFSADGMALEVFRVAPHADPERAWGVVQRDLEPAIAGQFALTARLAARAATVVEVVANDQLGLLATIGQTMAELGLDIRTAKVQTLGPQVVDTFYVVDVTGAKVTDDRHLGEIERALGHAIGL